MNRLLAFVAALAFNLVLVFAGSQPAGAQVFFANSRVNTVNHYHETVGTSTTLAISSSSVSSSLLGWQICNDAVNTSTYLYVGKASDVATDGVQLDKGQCYVCPNCNSGSLKLAKLKAQAASNGYSVVQFKQ